MDSRSRISLLLAGTALSAFVVLAPAKVRADEECCQDGQCLDVGGCFDVGWCIPGAHIQCLYVSGGCPVWSYNGCTAGC